jgi:hypothetical protein
MRSAPARWLALLPIALALLATPARAWHIDGTVYCDVDYSGTFTPADTPLAGITVQAVGQSSNATFSGISAPGTGFYSFTVLDVPETYDVEPTGLPAGDTLVGSAAVVVLTSAQNSQDNLDFLIQGCAPPPTTTTTTTTSTTTTTEPLRDAACYEVDHAAFALRGLPVTTRYGSATVDIIEPKRICNPANVNGEDPDALTRPDHLVGYVIRQTSRFGRVSGQQVTNGFGTITVQVVRPEMLLVPSAKSLSAPPPPLSPPHIDHFECYRIAGGRQRAPGVHVVDEFGTLTLDLKMPYRLCVPADVRGGGIPDPTANLLCYKVRVTPGTPLFHGPGTPVFINDELQAVAFNQVKHVKELCVLSTVTAGGSPSGAFLEDLGH